MKFEDFLKKHDEELGIEKVNPLLWKEIEGKTIENSAEVKPRSKKSSWILGISLIILIAISTYFYQVIVEQRQYFADEKKELRNEIDEIKSLLTESKSSQKIRGIQRATFVKQNLRGELTKTLLDIVREDDNLSVRFAALRALEPYRNVADVKIELIDLMTNTTNDNLRIRLISFFSHEKSEVVEKYIEQLLREEPRNPLLKKEAESALIQVRKI